MFSQGQLIFAGCFFITFVVAMIIAYRKDIKIHNEFYKGNYKILLGFLIFIGILFLIKIFFKR
jgi:Ca2+/Na+ antiporter